jgi:hypothetical protein
MGLVDEFKRTQTVPCPVARFERRRHDTRVDN